MEINTTGDLQNLREPLVSVIVVTFNSSKYVIETLESTKHQTYKNIELIVTDDHSTDNTVEICNQWLEHNHERFYSTEMITVQQNTGIPSNLNRGLRASNGEWVKLIAGDDTMEASFISKCIKVINENPDVVACYTNSNIINAKSQLIMKENSIKYKSGYIFDDIFFLRFWPKAPSFLIKSKILFDLGLFDENIWVEDYLMILKITSQYPVKHLNEYLINYRIHDSNAGSSTVSLFDAHLQSISHFKNYKGFKKRKQEIILEKIFLCSKIKKRKAMLEMFKNMQYLFQPLYLKSLLYIIVYWPPFMKKFSTQIAHFRYNFKVLTQKN